MKKPNINELFLEAEEDYQRAKEELYRPIEDVVAYSACISSRRALYKYLLGLTELHTRENEESFDNTNSIEELIKYNSKYSKELKDIDFSALNCKCEEMSELNAEDEPVYCTSVNKVSYCTGLAEDVRKILIEKEPSLVQN